ncbi:hypothetical protein GCM10007415_47350 [Parapedobacter pyrenivorans]|uniref:DUF11 domain-containing protein n=2 Tax=Parapedobacter pyrenivorans TaxID=1305674 RepID=A0A917MFP7_9SPHI|nr:hypothetical protein GCM10007415_47350 [Parapedobacter pyrenivorans]
MITHTARFFKANVANDLPGFMNKSYLLIWFVCVLASRSQAQEQTVHIVEGSSVTLTAASTGAISYLWFHNGAPINGSHDAIIIASEAGTYTVIGLGNTCNSDLSDPVEVIVDPGGEPVHVDMRIRNEPDRPTVFIGEVFSYQLMAVNNGSHTANGVVVTATLPQQVAYEAILGNPMGQTSYNPATRQLTWELGDIIPGQSESLTVSVRAQGQGSASQLAVVTSSLPDSNPADNEAVALVEVIALKVPNIFTPNGDGVNDYFRIDGLDAFPENRLFVFNRWGNEVYKAVPYKGDWNGSNLGDGTYYYVFELRLHNGHWQTSKGFVTIIRNAAR